MLEPAPPAVLFAGFYIHHLVATYGMKLKEVAKLMEELERFERVCAFSPNFAEFHRLLFSCLVSVRW